MTTRGFLSGPSAEARRPGQHHPPQQATTPPGRDSQAPACPGAVNREASTEPRANRSRGRAAVNAIALWLRHALTEPSRAWALAAGVPPDLCEPAAEPQRIDD
jgi:hypothetical protein